MVDAVVVVAAAVVVVVVVEGVGSTSKSIPANWFVVVGGQVWL